MNGTGYASLLLTCGLVAGLFGAAEVFDLSQAPALSPLSVLLGAILLILVVVTVTLCFRRKRYWLPIALPVFALVALGLASFSADSIDTRWWLIPYGLTVVVAFVGLWVSRQQEAALARAGRQEANTRHANPAWCPDCGAELPPDSPEGLCPRCLLQTGLSAAEPSGVGGGPISTSSLPHPGVSLSPTDLAGRFPHLEVLELLGQGGMGAVYKARQTKLDRLVAVKVLPPEWGKDPAFAERFGREARALARLNHPHVVAVHDFGEAGGLYYLVMEYVDGLNLRQLLTEGRLAPEEALRIIPQVCDALQYAHEEGIVHRDIKPENILIDRKGKVKIADFGLAKLIDRPRAAISLTGSQQVVGTLDYMAPEQRLRPLEVDHRADIYALGVVFYEMLTGELPLGRFAAPSEIAPIDRRLDEVVFRALEREPERRYQRVSQVKTAVEAIQGGRAPAAERVEAVRPAPTADLEMLQMDLKGPAAALIVTGIAALCYVTAVAIALIVSNTRPNRGPFEGPPDIDWPFFILGAAAVYSLVGTIFAGAVALARLHRYGLVLMAVLLAMLPLGPHVLIGIPAGVWTIAALHRPGVREGFVRAWCRRKGATADFAREMLKFQLRGPVVGLVAVGILAFAYVTAIAAALLIENVGRGRGPFEGPPDLDWPLFVAGAVLVYGLVGVILAGAAALARLVRYDLVMVAILLAMLPLGPHALVGIPIGIWALRALSAPEVKAAFARSLRRGGRPFAAAVPAPTGLVRRRLRSLVRSVRTMFFSVAGRPTPSEAEAVSESGSWQPPEPAGPPRQRSLLPLVFLPILPAAAVLAPVVFSRYVSGSHRSATAPWSGPTRATSPPHGEVGLPPMAILPFERWQGVEVDNRQDFFQQLGPVDAAVQNAIREALKTADQGYLDLEAANTTWVHDENGVLWVLIKPFPKQLGVLEGQLVFNLGEALKGHRQPNLIHGQPLYGNVFGRQHTLIRTWRTASGYNWQIDRSDRPITSAPGLYNYQTTAQLPPYLQRFWRRLALKDQPVSALP